jgi:hypothetical protein
MRLQCIVTEPAARREVRNEQPRIVAGGADQVRQYLLPARVANIDGD